jgi:hypothetical protein
MFAVRRSPFGKLNPIQEPAVRVQFSILNFQFSMLNIIEVSAICHLPFQADPPRSHFRIPEGKPILRRSK